MNPAIAAHEARRASAGLLLGLRTTEARADNPDPAADGHVRFKVDWQDPEDVRRFAIATLAGRCPDDDWPPEWPPSPNAATGDERQLAALVAGLELDRRSWGELITETYRLWSTPEFDRLERGLTQLLEEGHVLDEATLKRVHQISREAGMQHMKVKASLGRSPTRASSRQ
jgi:hypothetical protein